MGGKVGWWEGVEHGKVVGAKVGASGHSRDLTDLQREVFCFD